MSSGPSKEARILMAIEAIESSQKISLREAEAIFKVFKSIISDRMKGTIARDEYRFKNKLFDIFEEQALYNYLVDKDDREFNLNLINIENIADLFLEARGAPRINLF